MIQQTYDLLTSQKLLVDGSWKVVDDQGNVVVDNIIWRANPGALLTWPRPQSTPRSGYWREFFSQLQAEALLEYEEKPQPKIKVSPQKDKVPKPKKVTIELAKSRIVDTDIEPRPTISRPSHRVLAPSEVTLNTLGITQFIQQLSFYTPPPSKKMEDEDEDEVEELLLFLF